MRSIVALSLLSLLHSSLIAAEPYWNQFRGPDGSGATKAKGFPVRFSEGSKEIVWKTPVTGRAWSSPVVWGNQVWVTNAPQIQNPPAATNQNALPGFEKPLEKPIRLSAVCLDLETGKVLRDITCFEVDKPQYTHATNSYASPTPWIEEGRVYVHFGTYGTACIDTETGKKLWTNTELECHHWRGAGSSPVVHGELVFLCFDGFDKQFIAALDKNTGKIAWKKDRDVDYGTDNGDRKKAYGTPRVIRVDNRDLLISPFAMATIAYAPEDGSAIWKIMHGGMNAAARPQFGNGLVYINAGDGRNSLVAVDPKGKGDITKTNIRWRIGRMTPKRPSQILVGDRYYMVEDAGVVSCVDAKTGDFLWNGRIEGSYWASPLYADGHLYAFSQQGDVVVMEAGDEFKVVATNKLESGFNASPAVAGRSLILRTEKHVYRIAHAE